MNKQPRALTLPEVLTALTIVVVVGAVVLPVSRALNEALRGAANTQAIVSTVLQNARAIAIRDGKYAGVRFQTDNTGRQYGIYIDHVEQGISGSSDSFTVYYKAVEGRKPIPLPEGMALTDMVVGSFNSPIYNDRTFRNLEETDILNEAAMTDTTSFSVIFDSKGRLAKVVCRMRNRQGKYLPNDGGSGGDSNDKIFNSEVNVDLGLAQFVQDDYGNLGLGAELSRVQLKIFDKNKYNQIETAGEKFNYLDGLDWLNVNQYTGKLEGN